jgi:hypothetical protein
LFNNKIINMMKNFTRYISILLLFVLALLTNASYAQLNGVNYIDPTGSNYSTNPSGTSGKNYTSFTNAVNALYTYGVNGAVTFIVSPGTYNDYCNFYTSISGASTTNRITFDGQGRSSVVLQTNANTPTVRFYNASYITFQNMSIRNTSSSYKFCVNFAYYASYDQIINCLVEVDANTSSLYCPISISNSSTSATSTTMGCDYNLVQNCTINNGYYGLSFYSYTTSTNYNNYNQFIGNTFNNQYVYGIYKYYASLGTVIKGNTFQNMYTGTTGYGIYSYYGNNTTIEANNIQPSGYGIQMYYENYFLSGTTNIINNMIGNFGYTSYHYGLYAYYSNNLNIHHNTIAVSPSSASYSYSAMYMYYINYTSGGATLTSSNCTHNILVNNGTGSAGSSIYAYYVNFASMNYNDYYGPSATYTAYFYNTSGTGGLFTSLASWQSSFPAFNVNSFNQNPGFFSTSNLHRIPTTGTMMQAPRISTILYDIDNQARATTTFIGADEAQTTDLDILSVSPSIIAKSGNNNVKVTLINNGYTNITPQSITLQYHIDNGSWISGTLTLSSNLTPGSTIQYTFPTQWNITTSKLYTLAVRVNPVLSGDPDAADSVQYTGIKIGMGGTYTINPSGSGSTNYTSFSAAIADLVARGVGDVCTFNCSAPSSGNIMNEAVNFTAAIPGASADNRIIFDGGGRTNFTITYNSNLPTIRLMNVSYVTFQNMTILNGGTSYFCDIAFKGNAKYNSFINCQIELPLVASTYYIPIMFANTDYVYSYSTTATGCDYNTIQGCTIKGGYYGVTMYGNSTTNENNNYNQFIGNIFTDQYQYVFYRYYAMTGLVIKNNTIQNMNSSYSGYAFYSYYGGNTTIEGNTIQPSYMGIVMYYENYYKSGTTNITNNMISNFSYSGGAYHYGLYLYYSNNLNIYHNSIVINPTSSSYSYSAMYMYFINYTSSGATLTSTNVNNNIIVNMGSGGAGSCMYAYYVNFASMNYNDYYMPSASYFAYFYNTSGTGGLYNTYSQFQSAFPAFNTNSFSLNPNFIDNKLNLHRIPTTGTMMQAPRIATVLYDIDNEARPSTTFIGADEAQPVDLDITALYPLKYKVGQNNVVVMLQNRGYNTIATGTSIYLQYTINGGTPVTATFVTTSPIVGGATVNYTFPTQWNVSATATYNICATITPKLTGDPDALDQICQNVSEGMAGIYTINALGTGTRNFVSFTAAVNSLQTMGVADVVTFQVAKGTYTEAVNFTQAIYGASDLYPVVFDGGTRADVILTYNGNLPTIRLLNVSYVTFKNMTITNAGSSYFCDIAFKGNAKYNKFINCQIELPLVASTYYIPIMFANTDYAYSYSTPATGCDYNLFQGNTIKGGYFGVTMYNNSSTTNANNYNQFIGNIFTDQFQYCIYRYYAQTGLVIKNNQFINMAPNYSGYAIQSYYASNTTIDGNIIQPGYIGVYLYYENMYVTGTSYVTNNMVSNYTYQYGAYGLYLYFSNNIIVQHNTVAINPSNASYSYYAMYLYYINYTTSGGTLIQSKVDNNIFMNLSVPGNSNYSYCIYSYYATLASMNYNDYYYPNAPYIVSWMGSSFSNLTSWKASYPTYNQNSYDQIDPQVKSYTNLHLNPGAKGLTGVLTNVLTDVDNDPRCSLVGFVGADEPFHALPTIGFIAADTICMTTPVTFYNQGLKNEPWAVTWSVDGVQKANTFDFVYSFKTPKWDTVQMVYQSCLRKDTVTKKMYVAPATKVPKTEFMINKNVAETNEDLQLLDLSQNCPDKWLWDIYPDSMIDPADGLKKPAYSWVGATMDTFQAPMIRFYYPGLYGVCLSNQNGIGKGTKVCKNNYINIKLAQNMCGTSTESAEPYGSLYDDGGAGSYSANGATCTYLIKSCGDEVEATFSQLTLGSGSYLRLYDGINNKGIKLWDAAYGANGIYGDMSNALFKTVYKSTQSGMMYIEFQKGVNPAPGFKLEWTTRGKKTMAKPDASFTCEDTGCVVYPFYYDNTTTNADYNFTRFRWDYDGNGVIDALTEDGVFNTSFPGVSAIYTSRLMADNCGGVDTFIKNIVLVNPSGNPKGDLSADVTKPLVGQDMVTLSNNFERLSCVNTWEWTITPLNWYLVNGTTVNSAHPQYIFTDTGCFNVTLKMGNVNSAYTTTITKSCYIKPLTYCTPVITTKHQDIGISRVKIGTIDNKSAIGVAAYTSYTNVTSTNIISGQKTPITIERISAFNPMSRYVWIDYNGNGSFEDAGELVLHQDSSKTLSWTDTILVPSNTKLGATTMRIGTNYAGYKNTSCGPNLFGEYEDYRLFVYPDNVPPVITIIGNNPQNVEVGYPYTDLGATAIDNIQGNVTSKIVTTSTVDTTKMGSYTVTYKVCDDLNNCATAVRTVNMTADLTPPVITLLGKSSISQSINYPYVEPGYLAYDRADGNITANVQVTTTLNVNKIGNYYIVYSVKDKAGFTTTATRLVEVKDDAPPSISLIGPNPLYLEIGNAYTEPGVVYADNYWPNNKITYQRSGFVDTTRVGSYNVYYSVTDASGNGPNTITRKVIVWDSTAPVATITGNDVVMLEVHSQYYDPGVTIKDNSKKGFTVVKTGSFFDLFPTGIPDSIGLFSIFYQVYDEAGNVSNFVARVIEVVDIRAPELTLKGDPYLSIEKWSTFVDPGYSVTDNYYAAKDLKIDTFNNVNIHKTGIYQVRYSAKDPSGNLSPSVVRLVRVIQTMNGIAENNQPSLGVYPNPSNGKFILSLYLPQTLQARISVFNQLGEEVSLIHSGNITSAEFSVDLSQMPSGVYTVKVQTENASLLKRVIINK